MKLKLALFAAALSGAMALGAPASAAESGGHAEVHKQSWSFAGVFGHYDQAQLQRGFKVFREVCSNCHSANLLAFRTLADAGGPQFSEAQVKELAAQYKVKELSDKSGDIEERDARPSDRWPAPFPNEIKAREAMGGALPPDFSVLAKARTYHRPFPLFLIDALPGFSYQEHGPDYIVALLNGYRDEPPAGQKLDAGQSWNDIMPGNRIGMAKPLADGQVDYTDGTPATAEQYSKDVAAFMMWLAEPKLEDRKRTGFRVVIFLAVLAGLLYASKKRIWAKVQH